MYLENKKSFQDDIKNIFLSFSMKQIMQTFLKRESPTLINSFVLSNCSYCPLVWMLKNAKSVHKIKAIQKRALCFMLNDYESSNEDLLKKSGNPSMNLKRTRSLCTEIYKIVNNLNSEFMKILFKVRKTNRAWREQAKFRNPKI